MLMPEASKQRLMKREVTQSDIKPSALSFTSVADDPHYWQTSCFQETRLAIGNFSLVGKSVIRFVRFLNHLNDTVMMRRQIVRLINFSWHCPQDVSSRQIFCRTVSLNLIIPECVINLCSYLAYLLTLENNVSIFIHYDGISNGGG